MTSRKYIASHSLLYFSVLGVDNTADISEDGTSASA